MFKRLATTLNRLVAYLFTAPSVQMEIRLSDTASNSPVKSGQLCKDAQTPAPQKRKPKPSAVQYTIVEASPKRTRKLAPPINGKDGLLLTIPASKTHLPVKPAVKAKAVRVPSIKAALLSQQEQAPVLTPTEALSGERGQLKTRASKTHQVAKAAPTKKPKAAASTTAAKKTTKSKTRAQTRTVRQSKAAGR